MPQPVDVKEEIVKVIKRKGLSETASEVGVEESALYQYLYGDFVFEQDYKTKILNYILDLKSYTRYGSCEGFFFRIVDDRETQYCMITIDSYYNIDSMYPRLTDWEPGPLSPIVPKLELMRTYYKDFECYWTSYFQKAEDELLEAVQKKIFQLKKRWTKFYS